MDWLKGANQRKCFCRGEACKTKKKSLGRKGNSARNAAGWKCSTRFHTIWVAQSRLKVTFRFLLPINFSSHLRKYQKSFFLIKCTRTTLNLLATRGFFLARLMPGDEILFVAIRVNFNFLSRIHFIGEKRKLFNFFNSELSDRDASQLTARERMKNYFIIA